MTFKQYEELVDTIDMTKSPVEKVKAFQAELLKYGCDIEHLIFDDLDMDIIIEYTGKYEPNYINYFI